MEAEEAAEDWYDRSRLGVFRGHDKEEDVEGRAARGKERRSIVTAIS